MSGSVLVRGGRIVGLDDGVGRVADVRIRDGVVVEVGPALAPAGEAVLDAAGGWVIPGLWDAHVHFGQYARSRTWLDVAGTAGPEQVCARVAAALAGRPDDGRVLVAFGYRSAPWPRLGTVAELDAASGGRPVVAVAGDVHNGWLNSAALALLGLPPREGPLAEGDWFEVFARLATLPGGAPSADDEDAVAAALAARGLVGIVDLEHEPTYRDWPARVRRGQRSLRVRAGFYPERLDEVVAAGLRSGDALPGAGGLVTLGPLKVIFDGSMGTRSAWCFEPYADAAPDDPGRFGAPNLSPEHLRALLARARSAGLGVAVHAIGDRANGAVLDAFEATGARGSVEHAQLLRRADVPRFAALEVVASLQPHHLVADRDAAGRVWPDRTDRLFPARSLVDAGATLALGSDAPVSPPDPWLAMATAVHRSGDDRPAWHAEQSLTPLEALRSSVDGRRVRVGAPGDLVVLGADPVQRGAPPEEAARRLSSMPVLATVCAGRQTFGGA